MWFTISILINQLCATPYSFDTFLKVVGPAYLWPMVMPGAQLCLNHVKAVILIIYLKKRGGQ